MTSARAPRLRSIYRIHSPIPDAHLEVRMASCRTRNVESCLVRQDGDNLRERDDRLAQQRVRSLVVIPLFLHPQCKCSVQVDPRQMLDIEGRPYLLYPIQVSRLDGQKVKPQESSVGVILAQKSHKRISKAALGWTCICLTSGSRDSKALAYENAVCHRPRLARCL
jgi:hypothetical protein